LALPRLSHKADLDVQQGYAFEADGDAAGVLRIRHDAARDVVVSGPNLPVEAATALQFDDASTLIWYPSAVPLYNAYRGTIAPGTWAFNHVCWQPGLSQPQASDPEIPPPGSGFYYLVSAVNGCGEGSLGTTSSGAERPNTSRCP
jgi:hypothetical protein